MQRKILVTGATGLLGPYLVEGIKQLGSVVTTGRVSGDVPCDLNNIDATKKLIKKVVPDIILHAAALTDVEACEKYPDKANALNANLLINLVNSVSRPTHIIMISTDQVYPNTKGPHTEGDEAPVNSYGRSKLAGEIAASKHSNSLILRTNFFGKSLKSNRNSLSDFFINSFQEKQNITLYTDVLFSPLHMSTIADIIPELVTKNATGVYNLGSRQGMSKARFALEMADKMGLSSSHALLERSEEIDRAPRTKDLRMNVKKIEKFLNRQMPTLSHEIFKL